MSTGRFTRKMRDGDSMEFFTSPGMGLEVTLHSETQELFLSGASDIEAREFKEVDGGWEIPLRKQDWFRIYASNDENETPILIETKRMGGKLAVTVDDPACRRAVASAPEDTDDAP